MTAAGEIARPAEVDDYFTDGKALYRVTCVAEDPTDSGGMVDVDHMLVELEDAASEKIIHRRMIEVEEKMRRVDHKSVDG